uniref:C2H2-type domain-containing protein n=1 Tax=Cyprinodon variegatus TaxID=28743 RepID=A0A3Q2G6B1_CYPVA
MGLFIIKLSVLQPVISDTFLLRKPQILLLTAASVPPLVSDAAENRERLHPAVDEVLMIQMFQEQLLHPDAWGKPYGCDFCGQRFNLKSYLSKHIRVHTGEKPFRCSVCDQRFNLKSHLNLHQILHSGEKPFGFTEKKVKKDFICDNCGKNFTLKNSLKRHLRIHTGEKPFGCDVCGQRFNQKSHLKIHRRIHTGEKPFGCDTCELRFNQKSSLNLHMRIHSVEKPFSCDGCEQRFNKKSDLNKHKKSHMEEKPFGCDVCGKRFSRKADLNMHTRVHTAIVSFSSPASCPGPPPGGMCLKDILWEASYRNPRQMSDPPQLTPLGAQDSISPPDDRAPQPLSKEEPSHPAEEALIQDPVLWRRGSDDPRCLVSGPLSRVWSINIWTKNIVLIPL